MIKDNWCHSQEGDDQKKLFARFEPVFLPNFNRGQ